MGFSGCGGVWGVWGGSTGALRAVTGLTLLTSVLSLADPPQSNCTVFVPPNVTQPEYHSMVGRTIRYNYVRSLIRSTFQLIHPTPFPKELFLHLVNFNSTSAELNAPYFIFAFLEHVQTLWRCVLGFLTYMGLMPLLGVVFACCRCCGHLGGRLYQPQTPFIHCQRRTFYFCTLVISIIMFAGNINMFKSNQNFSEGLDLTTDQLNYTLTNILRFIQALPEHVSLVENEAVATTHAIIPELDILNRIGDGIKNQFKPKLDLVEEQIMALVKPFKTRDRSVTTLRNKLPGAQDSLQRYVTITRTGTERFFERLCPYCVAERTQFLQVMDRLDLDMDMDFTELESHLERYKMELNNVRRIGLGRIIKAFGKFLKEIPTVVSSACGAHDTSNSTAKDAKIAKNFDVVINKIKYLQGQIDDAMPYVAPVYGAFREIWFLGGFIICGAVLSIVMSNCVAMILGLAGLKPKADPTMRSKTSHCGGLVLLLSTALSFLLSWILMLVVVLLFAFGATVYTQFCRPLRNGQLFEAVDATHFIATISDSLGLRTKVTVEGIRRDCAANQTLWSVFHMDEIIDLEKELDVAQNLNQMLDCFANKLSKVVQVPATRKQRLAFERESERFFASVSSRQIDNLINVTLDVTARSLELAYSFQLQNQQVDIFSELLRELWERQAEMDRDIIWPLTDMSTAINTIMADAESFTGSLTQMLRNVQEIRQFIKMNMTQVVKTHSQKLLECHRNRSAAFINWATLMITQEIGQCRPLAEILNFLDHVFCSSVIEPLNVFWFSLLCCLTLFIPNIIFTIRLSRFLRRMEFSDQYDEAIVVNDVVMYPDGKRLKVLESFYFGEL